MKSLSELGNFRVTLDESWQHEHPELRKPRLWYERIPCQGGAFISLYCLAELPCPLHGKGCPLAIPDCQEHGGPILKLWTPRPQNGRAIWQKLKVTPSCHLDQMDGETDLFFPDRLLPLAAEMAKARKKRRLSPEHRARLVAAGRNSRFNWKKPGAQGEKTAQNEAILVRARVFCLSQ